MEGIVERRIKYSSPSTILVIIVPCIAVFKSSASRRNITLRRLADVNVEHFRQDIFASQLEQNMSAHCTVESMVTQYNHVLGQLLDEHALQCTRSVYIRPYRSWYNHDIIIAKREKRTYERRWLKSSVLILLP